MRPGKIFAALRWRVTVYSQCIYTVMERKSEALILRIGAKEKGLIAEAAGRSGESMTTLVRRAALNEAKKILTKKGGNKMATAGRPESQRE
jgi:hypothetical protein